MSFLLCEGFNQWHPSFCLNYLITNIKFELEQKRMYFNDAKIIGESDTWNKGNRGAYFAYSQSLYKRGGKRFFLEDQFTSVDK